jgi:DNA-binding response OmpR family regulator
MPSPTIVIAQSNPRIAQGLANDLHAHFAKVDVANNAMELRTMLQRHEARVAVLDLECVNLEDVRKLAGNFNDLVIVCTHRSPDDRMWTEALNAGAAEFCHPQDLHCILRGARQGVQRNLEMAA